MPDINITDSTEQIQYIKNIKRQNIIIKFTRIFLLFFFLIIWELFSYTKIIDSFIFSSPSLILKTIFEMSVSHFLFSHVLATLSETLLSFVLVLLISIGTSIFLWCVPFLAKVLEPWLIILNSLPKSALAPLLIVWLGANQTTIIVSGISVAIFGSILNLYTGFQETEAEQFKMIRTMGGTKYHELTKLVLPSSIPLIFSIMKVNIGLCLVGVIIGEFIGARIGLGYLIIYGSQTFKLTWVLMSIFLLCLMALLLYGLLNIAERLLSKHF